MPITEENLPEFLQIIGDPAVQERLAAALAEKAAPPPLPQPQAQAAAPQQVPQQVPQQPGPAPAPPNVGAAIVGTNPIVQPDMAQFLKSLQIQGGR